MTFYQQQCQYYYTKVLLKALNLLNDFAPLWLIFCVFFLLTKMFLGGAHIMGYDYVSYFSSAEIC